MATRSMSSAPCGAMHKQGLQVAHRKTRNLKIYTFFMSRNRAYVQVTPKRGLYVAENTITWPVHSSSSHLRYDQSHKPLTCQICRQQKSCRPRPPSPTLTDPKPNRQPPQALNPWPQDPTPPLLAPAGAPEPKPQQPLTPPGIVLVPCLNSPFPLCPQNHPYPNHPAPNHPAPNHP